MVAIGGGVEQDSGLNGCLLCGTFFLVLDFEHAFGSVLMHYMLYIDILLKRCGKEIPNGQG